MSPLELVDDRFGELRAARPRASAELRAQIEALAPPPPRRTLPTLRRLAPAVALGLLAVSLGVAAVAGLLHSSNPTHQAVVRRMGGAGTTAVQSRSDTLRAVPAPKAEVFQRNLSPVPGRLQQYDATLGLRVKDVDALSAATKRAMTLTRALGGYVASVNYSTRSGHRGGALLVLRVPITQVQRALGELTSLGTILRQQTAVLDVTKRADRESKQIARLEQRLETVGPEEAAAIRAQLKTLRAKHARLLRSARLAKISLGLTTPAPAAAAPRSRLDRTLDDAGSVLARELQIVLYALIVAGPLLLLGGLAVIAARTQRVRADRRLLDRS